MHIHPAELSVARTLEPPYIARLICPYRPEKKSAGERVPTVLASWWGSGDGTDPLMRSSTSTGGTMDEV